MRSASALPGGTDLQGLAVLDDLTGFMWGTTSGPRSFDRSSDW